MKKNAIILSLVSAIAIMVASCGGLGEKKDWQLEKVGLAITVPGNAKIACDDSNDFRKARCKFYVGKKENEVQEIEMRSYPSDLSALEEAMKADEKFVAVVEKKTLPNGAFGMIYEKKGKTKNFKEFLFYFKKGERAYRITPIFNDGDYYEEIIEAIGTLK
jgi:hypothetical protein